MQITFNRYFLNKRNLKLYSNETKTKLIDKNTFNIDKKTSDKLVEYANNNVKCVAINDMGLIPINSNDSLVDNKIIKDIYSSYNRPKIKKITLKK